MTRTGEKIALSEGKQMPAVVEAGTYLRSFPRHADQSKPAWMRSAGRYFGLTFAQTKKLYYGEVKTIDADTFLRMRERLDDLKKQQSKRLEILDDARRLLDAGRTDTRGLARRTGSPPRPCERAGGAVDGDVGGLRARDGGGQGRD
jgi:hypothetical protein